MERRDRIHKTFIPSSFPIFMGGINKLGPALLVLADFIGWFLAWASLPCSRFMVIVQALQWFAWVVLHESNGFWLNLDARKTARSLARKFNIFKRKFVCPARLCVWPHDIVYIHPNSLHALAKMAVISWVESLTVVLAELEGRSVFSTTFRSDYQQDWVYYTL